MVICVSNGAYSLERAEIQLYIDDELVLDDMCLNNMLFGGLHTFIFKLDIGCHKVAVKTKVESNYYEKEIKICIGLAFVRWVDFELIEEPYFYNANGELIDTFILPVSPFDTIPQRDIKTVYGYEFLTRTSLFPLRFE
jgi:hypothetical protein